MENVEQRTKTDQEEWKEFMPPDDYVPEWKQQFQAMDREIALKRTSERALFAAIGAAIGGGTWFVPGNHWIALGVLVGGLFLLHFGCSNAATRMRLRAVEIDNKLNETVRIEPDDEPKKA